MPAIGREACPPCPKTDEMRYQALKTLSRNHRGRRPLVEGANRLSFKDPGKAGARALERAERVGDDFARGAALLTRGIVLANQPGERRAAGLELLARCGDPSERHGNSQWLMRFITTETANERSRLGDLDAAIAMAREAVDFLFASGDAIARGPAVSVLVESLLRRGTESDLAEAEKAIERLGNVPVDPGFVLYELPLLRLRALLARTHGDEAGYRQFADRYRTMADDLGFEGHIAIAEAMP
jgi:adenylate cyclase